MTTLRIITARATRPDLVCVLAALLATGATVAATAADGTPDTTFGTNGRVTIGVDIGGTLSDVAEAVADYPGGRVVVAGASVINGAGDSDIAVARLLPNGHPDTSFGGGGIVVYDGGGAYDEVVDVLVQPDGRILVLATTATFPGPQGLALTRLLAGGAPDPGFGIGGTWTFSSPPFDVVPAALGLRANGDIMIGGRLANAALGIRLNPAGAPQDVGSIEVPNLSAINDAVVTADGGLILAGSREFSAPDYDFLVVRLTSTLDGDPGFGTNAGYSSVPFDLGASNGDIASAVGLLPDGSIVAVGTAATAQGDDVAVLRLSASGTWTPDGRFHFGFYAPGSQADWGADLVVQSDGAVVVAGTVAYDGTLDRDFGVARMRYGVGGWALDAGFFNGGALWLPFDVVPGGDDDGLAVALAARGIVVAGRTRVAVDSLDMAVAKLVDSQIFADDFESGGVSRWSTAVGTNG